MKLTTATIIGAVSALFIAAVLYFFIIRKNRDGKLGNRFAQAAHNFFNFKYFLIEFISKFLYVYASFYYFIKGFFMMFVNYGYEWKSDYDVWAGIKVMIFGPILVRFVYELVMLYILRVKKIISIEAKLKDANPDNKEADPFNLKGEHVIPAAPVRPMAYAPYGAPVGYGVPGYGAPVAPGYGAPVAPGYGAPVGYAPVAPVAPAASAAPVAPAAPEAPAAPAGAPVIVGYDVNTGAPIYESK